MTNTPQSFLSQTKERYGDFIVKRHLLLEELNCTLRELEHLPSGAQVMHLDCEDPENLFCLSFKTYPSSSNGAAHILEHTVLCGSQKFPVKDPFFSMNRRSLNTFMNAMTGSDFTCYPAASQNEKDFYNLLEVYLDAVFHPELKKMSFLQEGHRLEFTQPQDPKSPLQIKGIVFNEMKGSLSSLESRLWSALMQHLVPDLPYAYNSGGDPAHIPSLSYADLLAFHETYYHPSRCLFFFYGNFALKKHLDFLSHHALKHVEKKSPIPSLPRQPRFTQPIHAEASYPISAEEGGGAHTVVAFGFLTAPLVEQEEVLALSLLDAALMDNDASLLKSRLLDSKLCVQVDAYMDTEMSEVPYAIVFKGCQEGEEEKLEKVLKGALQHIVETGIPKETILAALHQLEFSRLEIAADHAPFGLTLFMRSALAKQHACDPEKALAVYSLCEKMAAKIQDPHYFTSLIQKHWLSNPHCVRLTLHPDAHLCEKEAEIERDMLTRVRETLSPEAVQHIIEETQALALFQEEQEKQSLDCLPKVSLKDVSSQTRSFPLEHMRLGSFDLYHHDCFTNHLTYVDLFFDLPFVSEEDLHYVHLLTALLPELGCGSRSYAENLRYMQSYIGGIGLSCGLYPQIKNPTQTHPALHIRGKVLDRNLPRLFTLIYDMLSHPHLHEKERIEELLKKVWEAQVSQLNRRAMRYATSLALKGLSLPSYVQECWQGLTYFKNMERLIKELPQRLPLLIEKLSHLKEQLFTFQHPALVLSCSQESKTQILQEGGYSLTALTPTQPWIPYQLDYPLPPPSAEARTIASNVAFTVEAFKTVSYEDPKAAALTVATTLLDNLVLHRLIREQGGAYGCGANYNTTLGLFYFHAYRDPHLASTVRAFHHSLDALSRGEFTAQDLEEAKLGIIQQIDTPVSPGSRAATAYTWIREGKTEAMRQTFRDRLLNLAPHEVQETIQTCLLPQKETGILVSLAGKELLEKENAKLASFRSPLPLHPI